MEHLPELYQIYKIVNKSMIFLTKKVPKTSSGPKTDFLGLESGKSENQIIIWKILKNTLNLLRKFLCRMDHTLTQTSSRGSHNQQKRFGWKFKNTVKMASYRSGYPCTTRYYGVLWPNVLWGTWHHGVQLGTMGCC